MRAGMLCAAPFRRSGLDGGVGSSLAVMEGRRKSTAETVLLRVFECLQLFSSKQRIP
jgi:hypothetical protein